MNRQTANKILSSAAPAYTVSKATKNAYQNYRTINQKWNKQIQNSLNAYNALGDFDPAKSAYYQSAYQALKNVYRQNAKRDMQNAAASAAANTEGYGNSYAAQAGNAAYQSRLAELAAKVPSLYTAASEEHAAKKQSLADLIGLYQSAQSAQSNQAKLALDAMTRMDEARYKRALAADELNRKKVELWLKAMA